MYDSASFRYKDRTRSPKVKAKQFFFKTIFIFRPPSRPQYPSQPMPQQFPPNSGAASGFPPSSAAPSGSSTGGFPPTPTSPVQNLASRLGNYSLNQVKKDSEFVLKDVNLGFQEMVSPTSTVPTSTVSTSTQSVKVTNTPH